MMDYVTGRRLRRIGRRTGRFVKGLLVGAVEVYALPTAARVSRSGGRYYDSGKLLGGIASVMVPVVVHAFLPREKDLLPFVPFIVGNAISGAIEAGRYIVSRVRSREDGD